MNTVSTHLNKHEEVPVFLRDPLLDKLKTLLGHGIDLAQQIFLIVCTEIWHIHQVFTDGSLYFLHSRGRIGVRFIRVPGGGGEEAPNLDTVDGLRGICLWHTNSDHPFPCA